MSCLTVVLWCCYCSVLCTYTLICCFHLSNSVDCCDLFLMSSMFGLIGLIVSLYLHLKCSTTALTEIKRKWWIFLNILENIVCVVSDCCMMIFLITVLCRVLTWIFYNLKIWHVCEVCHLHCVQCSAFCVCRSDFKFPWKCTGTFYSALRGMNLFIFAVTSSTRFHSVVGYHSRFWFLRPGFESRWNLFSLPRRKHGFQPVFVFYFSLLSKSPFTTFVRVLICCVVDVVKTNHHLITTILQKSLKNRENRLSDF